MLEAIFTETTMTVTLTGLTQWDYGQKLYIKGLELPEVLEVHFSNNREKEAIVRTAVTEGSYSVVAIPDVMLEKNADIIAYVYLVGHESGETIRSVILKVEPRVKPHNYVSAYPDAEKLLHDVLDKINNNIADNTSFKADMLSDYESYKQDLTNSNNAFQSGLKSEQQSYFLAWSEKVDGSIKEAQRATEQCYNAISSLQIEIFDMNGGDPFTQHTESDFDANGGYPV